MGKETKGYHRFCCCCSDDCLLLSRRLSKLLLCLCSSKSAEHAVEGAAVAQICRSWALMLMALRIIPLKPTDGPRGRSLFTSIDLPENWAISITPLMCHLICRRWGFHRDHPCSARRMRVIYACDLKLSIKSIGSRGMAEVLLTAQLPTLAAVRTSGANLWTLFPRMLSRAKKDKKTPMSTSCRRKHKPSYEISAVNDYWEEKTAEKPWISSSRMGETTQAIRWVKIPGESLNSTSSRCKTTQGETLSEVNERE